MTLYSLVLVVHISAFVVNIATIIISDIHAFLWVKGWYQVLPERRMIWLHRVVSVGLAVSIASGVYLFWGVQDYLATVKAFQVKVALVVMLVVNAFVIHRHMSLAFSRPFVSLSHQERLPLFLSGAVSTFGWVGVFTAAQFLGL